MGRESYYGFGLKLGLPPALTRLASARVARRMKDFTFLVLERDLIEEFGSLGVRLTGNSREGRTSIYIAAWALQQYQGGSFGRRRTNCAMQTKKKALGVLGASLSLFTHV
jgi:hypothetical protein